MSKHGVDVTRSDIINWSLDEGKLATAARSEGREYRRIMRTARIPLAVVLALSIFFLPAIPGLVVGVVLYVCAWGRAVKCERAAESHEFESEKWKGVLTVW